MSHVGFAAQEFGDQPPRTSGVAFHFIKAKKARLKIENILQPFACASVS